MNSSLLHSWSKLSVFQKLAALGLIVLGLSLPLAILSSAQTTRLNSDAFVQKIPLSEEKILQQKLQLSKSGSQTGSSKPKNPPILDEQCRTAGCSGELCIGKDDPNMATTCVYREEYACYKKLGRCETQSNTGKCGWTQTRELMSCLGDNADDATKEQVIPDHASKLEEIKNQPKTESNVDALEIRKIQEIEALKAETIAKPTSQPDALSYKQNPHYYPIAEEKAGSIPSHPSKTTSTTTNTNQRTAVDSYYPESKPNTIPSSRVEGKAPKAPTPPRTQVEPYAPDKSDYNPYQYDEVTPEKVDCTPRPSCMDDNPPCQVFYEDPSWCPPTPKRVVKEPTPIPLPVPRNITLFKFIRSLFGL